MVSSKRLFAVVSLNASIYLSIRLELLFSSSDVCYQTDNECLRQQTRECPNGATFQFIHYRAFNHISIISVQNRGNERSLMMFDNMFELRLLFVITSSLSCTFAIVVYLVINRPAL